MLKAKDADGGNSSSQKKDMQTWAAFCLLEVSGRMVSCLYVSPNKLTVGSDKLPASKCDP